MNTTVKNILASYTAARPHVACDKRRERKAEMRRIFAASCLGVVFVASWKKWVGSCVSTQNRPIFSTIYENLSIHIVSEITETHG